MRRVGMAPIQHTIRDVVSPRVHAIIRAIERAEGNRVQPKVWGIVAVPLLTL